jgi:1-acyl-sn-glycerol-3-phosphate acyltransferase
MDIKYISLITFIIFIIISFSKIGKNINRKVIIITFYIYNEFNMLFKLPFVKKNKGFKVHPSRLTKILKTKITEKYNSHNIIKKKCIYLCNHRSWADFWTDFDIVGGACFISRNIMKKILPITALVAKKSGDTIFFNRGNTDSKYELYKKILEKIKKRNVLIYPEGTRHTSNKSKPLKMGIIKLAYENNIPLQIIITSNKEKIFSQKNLTYNKNIHCKYYASEKISPSEYSSLSEFIESVQEIWNESWNEIYN